MKEYESKKCKSCGAEFVPKRSNQVYCKPDCPQTQKMLFGGGVKRRGKTTTVSGVLNCYGFIRGW